jgi:hypothetical protein
MVLGLGGLLAIPKPLEEPKPMFKRTTRASDLAQLPCSDQAWPMIDRRCQSWTAARPGDSKNEEVASKKEEVAAKKEDVARAPNKEELPPKKEPIERRPEKIEPSQEAATVSERWPVAPLPAYSESTVGGPLVEVPLVAEPAPKPAEVPQPQPASEALAQAPSAPPAAPTTAASRPSADRTSKPRQAEKPRDGIQVTVQTSDRNRRTITVKPTSQQDAMYYAARRNVGIGGLFGIQ